MQFVLLNLVFLFCIEIVYISVASKFRIVDKPNLRSSHKETTIRGGGIIFTIAVITYCVSSGMLFPWFLLGLFLIATISFIDDVITLSNKIRFSIHLFAVSLLINDVGALSFHIGWLICIFILVLGIINAYNFMDGINGMTGLYSLVIIASLFFVNTEMAEFIPVNFLVTSALSICIFLFFNFRSRAKVFAGDIGSIGIAFIIMFLLIKGIIVTENLNLLLFLLVYGLDTVTTIVIRLCRRENIFLAHRQHFYQFLTNELQISHVKVSILYTSVQLLINVVVVFYIQQSYFRSLLLILLSTCIFLALRYYIQGRTLLLRSNG